MNALRRDPGRRARRASSVAIPVATCLVFALWRVIAGDPMTNGWQDLSIDARFVLRGSRPAPKDVAVVAIDSTAVDRFGWSPPPRDFFAKAIRRILAARPAALAVDMLFLDATKHDAALASALGPRLAPVILGTAARYGPEAPETRSDALKAALLRSAVGVVVGKGPTTNVAAPRLLAPRDAFLGSASLGHVNIITSSDRVARRVPLTEWVGSGLYLPSLALSAAIDASTKTGPGSVVLRPGDSVTLGERRIRTDRNGAVLVNDYGKRGSITTYAVGDVVDGRVPATALAGRTVFLGITADSLADEFATAYDPHLPGVEFLATLAANLLHGDVLVQNGWTAAASVILAGLAVLALLLLTRMRRLTLVAVGQSLVWLVGLGAMVLGFSWGNLVFDAPAVLFALVLGTGWSIWQRVTQEALQSGRLATERQNLAHYVSPILAEDLARSARPDFEGRTQPATVLFVDLAGYTTLSENLSPAETQQLLSGLHHVFETGAAEHRGVVVGFMGDGAMIAFGLPAPEQSDAARALACGRTLLRNGARLTAPGRPDVPLRMRVSAHSGPVMAGVAGGEHQAQVTLNGDTVNVASRLQEVAKANGVAFVASRATLDAAEQTDPEASRGFALLGTEPIRGRHEPIEVWAT